MQSMKEVVDKYNELLTITERFSDDDGHETQLEPKKIEQYKNLWSEDDTKQLLTIANQKVKNYQEESGSFNIEESLYLGKLLKVIDSAIKITKRIEKYEDDETIPDIDLEIRNLLKRTNALVRQSKADDSKDKIAAAIDKICSFHLTLSDYNDADTKRLLSYVVLTIIAAAIIIAIWPASLTYCLVLSLMILFWQINQTVKNIKNSSFDETKQLTEEIDDLIERIGSYTVPADCPDNLIIFKRELPNNRKENKLKHD